VSPFDCCCCLVNQRLPDFCAKICFVALFSFEFVLHGDVQGKTSDIDSQYKNMFYVIRGYSTEEILGITVRKSWDNVSHFWDSMRHFETVWDSMRHCLELLRQCLLLSHCLMCLRQCLILRDRNSGE
jgi:hypothetical protein